MSTDRPRTLAEMTAEADVASNGVRQWTCQRCGGRLWWVVDSRFVARDGSRRRTRECRKCHQSIHTMEIIKPTGRQEGDLSVDE